MEQHDKYPIFFSQKSLHPTSYTYTRTCAQEWLDRILCSVIRFLKIGGGHIIYYINITEAKIYALFRTLSKYKSLPYSGLGRVNDYFWGFVLVQTQNKLCFIFKGQCHEICDIFSCCFNLSTLSPYEQAKRVSRTFSFLRRYSSENHVSG